MWGVFYEDKKEIHVAPCDQNGDLKEPHILDSFCWCAPRIMVDVNGYIIVHNEEN